MLFRNWTGNRLVMKDIYNTASGIANVVVEATTRASSRRERYMVACDGGGGGDDGGGSGGGGRRCCPWLQEGLPQAGVL